MATNSALFCVLGLLALANAAPWPADFPKCAIECPVTRTSLLSYVPEKTYSYSYSGKSEVHLKDLENGVSMIEWSAHVDLTWLSHCDVAITFRNPVVDGSAGSPDARFLERYPLVIAVTDGRVQHVCTHPDDDTWSINMKKGIASAFQNSLPTTSAVSSGLEFIETDVVGKCPTKYEITKNGNTSTVKKEKNHRRCEHRYPTPSETPAAWLKAPLPLEESKSECTQVITNGIYSSIVCHDKNIIRPSYGSYKYVETQQKSKLQYEKESGDAPESVSNLHVPLMHKSLLYDHETLKKDPSLVPQLYETLKQICEKTKQSIEEDVAPLMVKILSLLRRIPGNSIEPAFRKITSGQICSEHQRLEALFLDAIAFVHDPSVVGIMVKELSSGRAIEGRATLYTAALHLTPRPNIQAIAALKPLFESSRLLGSAKLAAGSMVHSYCRHNPHCQNEVPIRQLAETIASKIQQKCTPSGNEEAKQEVLASLKALGNMGVMNSEVARSVISCIEADGVQNNIRVAAAQAFRNAKCQAHATKQLVSITTDETKNTEIRIASYLAAIRCVKKEDLNNIISKITQEENTQVRGFILSHLLNLQESSDPHKENLRYLLTDTVLPVNFTTDFKKYSRNIDLSYYIQSLGMGAGYKSDVVFAPGSYIPRSVNLNFTSLFGGIPINLGEFGARMEGLEPIMKKLIGPKGYLQKSSLGKIVHDVIRFIEEKSAKLFKNADSDRRHRRSIDVSTISNFLKKIYGKGHPEEQKADVYARFNGQEMAYGSWSGDLSSIDISGLVDSLLTSADELLDQLTDIRIDTARTAQVKLDYSLPTIQGIPLKLQMEGTAVFGFKMGSKLNSLGGTESKNVVEVLPGLSLQVSAFVGFDLYLAKTGMKMENLISSDNGLSMSLSTRGNELQFEISLPKKMELFNIKSETYLMKAMKGHQETKVIPQSIRNIRIQNTYCISSLQSALGLQVCYDLNIPNVFLSTGLPLGQQSLFKIFVKKTDTSMRGYLFKAVTIHGDEGSKILKVRFEVPGSSPPIFAESTILYNKEQDNHIISASIESPNVHSSIWINLIQQVEYKAIQTFANWNSNGVQSVGGIKVDLKTRWTGPEKEVELNVYSSRSRQFSPESRIVEVRFTEKTDGQQVQVDLIARTMGDIRRFIDFNFMAGGDLRYSQSSGNLVPERLRSLELHFNTRYIAISSYVRKTSENQYKSAFKITEMNAELVGIFATHDIEGNTEHGFHIITSAKGHIGAAAYKWSLDTAFSRFKKGFSLITIRQNGDVKILDIEAFYSHSAEVYTARFVVDVPEYMKAIKMMSNLTKQEEDRYMLEAAFSHGSQRVLQLDGPITAAQTISSVKFGVNIRIIVLVGSPITVSSTFEWASKKQVMRLVIKNQEELLFSYNWLFTVDSTQRWIIGMKFNFPILADCNTEVVIMDKSLQANINTLLFPKSVSSRRIKSRTEIDFEKMEANLDISWDIDHDHRRITAEIRLTPNPTDTDHFIFRGKVNYLGQNYDVMLDISGFDEHPWKRDFRVKFTAPSGQSTELVLGLRIRSGSSFREFEVFSTYKNLQGLVYDFTNIIRLEDYYAEGGFKITSHSRYKVPESLETTLDTETKYIDILSERLLNMKMRLSSPRLQAPMEIEFIIDNKIDVYLTSFTANLEVPLNIFKWKIVHHPYRGVQSVILDMDMSAAIKLLETIHNLASFNYQRSVHAPQEVSQSHSFHVNYNRPASDRQLLVVKTPSRTMEGEVEYSPTGYRLRFYPNKEGSIAKYEIASITGSTGVMQDDQLAKWHGIISHPSLTRDMKASLLYTIEGDRMKGTIEIDIFQNEADKIVGTMESKRVTSNSIWIEATLTARALKISPKVSVTAAYAPHIISFDFAFRKTASSEVSFEMAGRIDRSHGSEAALAFTVIKERQSIIEFSGSVSPEEGSQCFGLGLQAIAQVTQFGHYKLNSRVCHPSFLEVSVNKEGKPNIYIVRMGYQDPSNAELSLSVEDIDTLQRLPVLMAKVSLASPTLINIDLAKENDQLSQIKNFAHGELERIASVVPSWVTQIINHLKSGDHLQSGQFPPSEFFKLIEEIKREVKEIYHDIVRDVRENPLWMKMKPYIVHVLSRLEELQRNILVIRNRIDLAFQQDFQGLADMFVNVAIKILRMFEDGQFPSIINWIFNVVQNVPGIHMMEQALEDLIQKYPEDVEALKQIVSKIIDRLEEDIDDIRNAISKIPPIQREINWLMGNYNHVIGLQMDKIITQILNELLLISVKSEENHLQISVPTHRPINSLVQAVQFTIPKPANLFKDLIWKFYSFEPTFVRNLIWVSHAFSQKRFKDLFLPNNRTAMIVEGKEILTFDGVVLRAPPSPCKILLAAYESNSLVMEHPQSAAAQQLTLKTPEVTVIIKPDYRVSTNGQDMSGSQETHGDVQVSKVSGEVIVRTPFMVIRVYKGIQVVSVEVTGWVYGEIAGLLGSYDGEVANDWFTPRGTKASSLQELVRSWQEDQQCQTPSISPVDPSRVPESKAFQCHAFLDRYSICNSIIHPDPFIKMCYAARDVRSAEWGYYAMCATKGAQSAFPPQ